MKGNDDKKRKIFTGFFWRFAESCGAQGVSFIVSIVLARLLAPDVYGSVSLVTVFITICRVFVDSGMGNALIRKKDADDLDFSTVFYFNMALCLVIYLMVFIAAPWIARFYHLPELTAVIRVLGLVILISGIKNVQQAYVSRNMLFQHFFKATLAGTAGAAVAGIMLAYLGAGIWALVVQQLLNTAVDTLILWLTVTCRPRKMFSWVRLRQLYAYGWKMLAAALLDTIYNNIRQMIIGKLYFSEELAYYNRGRQFPELIISNVNTSIDSVLLPAMADVQEHTDRVREMTRRSIQTGVYIMAPLLVGIMVMAPVIVDLVLTDKWRPCIPYMRIFCVTYLFYPVHTANLNAVKALGRSDIVLKLEVVKKLVGLILLFSTMWSGVMAMAYSMLAGSVLCQIINAWPNRKLLNYSYMEQLKDILPAILLACGMGAAVWGISFLHLAVLHKCVIQIAAGTVCYLSGSVFLKMNAFYYLWETLQQLLQMKGKTDI